MSLLEKIKNRSAVVGVVGLGYVGLPLAVLQAEAGFKVLGFDEVKEKVAKVGGGESYILDVNAAELQQVVRAGKLLGT
ncbi:MAG: NAD(P)-binding domain-containing protein, partial [Nitrospiraceae bacterium]